MLFLKGHRSGKAIKKIAFAPDGQRLASVCTDRTVRLWDLLHGESRIVAQTNSHAVTFSPCGKWLVFGNYNETVRICLDEQKPIRLKGTRSVPRALAFSPDGKLLASGGHRMKLHDGRAWEPEKVWPKSGYCPALAFRCDGRLLASAHFIPAHQHPMRHGQTGIVYATILWKIPGGKKLAELSGPTQPVTSLAFSPCGTFLTATAGRTLWVWDVASGEIVQNKRIDRRHFQACAYAPDGRWLATGNNDGRVRLYEPSSWNEFATYDWDIGPVLDIVVAPDGMKAAASGRRGQIVVWDVGE
jgi:WD40 repeat protein